MRAESPEDATETARDSHRDYREHGERRTKGNGNGARGSLTPALSRPQTAGHSGRGGHGEEPVPLARSGVAMGENRARVHAIVVGLVQGVGFRVTTVRQARRLGLRGLVRNLASGAVEVEAEGERADLEALVEFLKVGPAAARVREVRVSWLPYVGDLPAFEAALW